MQMIQPCFALLIHKKTQEANMNDINIELVKISEWLKANKLSLNVAKYKCMVFHHPMNVLLTLTH